MVVKPGHLIVAALGFGTSVYAGYRIGTASKQLPAPDPTHGCAFDRLAGVYDDIVGIEETGMLIGLMRRLLLRKAQGDVLELSAGTGRNLPYFPYSKINSLTLTDISTSMLQQAQRKFFDDLQLNYKQPDLTCKFMLADAEHMVAGPGQQPHAVLLPPFPISEKKQSSNITGWRLKQPGSSSTSSSGASSDTGADPADAAATSSTKTASATSTAGSTDRANLVLNTSSGSSNSSNSNSSSSSTTTTTTNRGWSWARWQPKKEVSPDEQSSSSHGGSAGPTSLFAPHSFDVVVDTFGLCSCENPVQVLQQAALLLRPGGKLLLLEHGRGSYNWVNTKLDESAERHYHTYGCWYNKDMLQIVEESGLKVDSVSRWHFGTSYYIVASPSPQQQLSAALLAAAAA